jgi:DNA polymerase-1
VIAVGFDCESHLIKPGLLAPRMVCASWAWGDKSGGYVTALELRDDGLIRLRGHLRDPQSLIVGANLPYDFGVAAAEDPKLLPLIFDAYDTGRVRCVQTHQKLIDVALGMRKFRRVNGVVTPAKYSLADLVALYFNEHLEKIDTHRLRYAFLDGVPIDEWPPEAVEYAISDAVQALRVHEAQLAEELEIWGEPLPNDAEQQRAAWALHLMSMWGVRADPVAVKHFVEHCEREIAAMNKLLLDSCEDCGADQKAHDNRKCPKGRFKNSGILRDNGDGTYSRTMAEIRRRVVAACERAQVDVPMTPPSAKFPDGQVKTDGDTLEESEDRFLLKLAESLTFAKYLGQWGPVCEAAVHRPVCARYNELVDNGRTSCSGSEGQEGTNFQNPPRKGDVRPCFIPRGPQEIVVDMPEDYELEEGDVFAGQTPAGRLQIHKKIPGNLYCSTDADTIELRANAQNCLEMVGESRMAEVLWDQHRNGGPDLHVVMAANVAGISPMEALALHNADDVAFANIRQLSKHGNFAFAGGAGAKRFVFMAWGFGIDLAGEDIPGESAGDWFDRALARSTNLRGTWFETWPEEPKYFRVVNGMMDRATGTGTIQHPMSGRIRGDVNFPAAANSFFSGRVADAMKEILFRLAYECYTGRTYGSSGLSILYGSRPVMFLHDEPILEHPEDGTESERAARQQQIVVEVLSKWMPDVPCTSSAVLMRRWQKGGKPLFIDKKLVPVKPLTIVGADGKEKVKWVHDTGEDERRLAA